jgi:hypothetical protein
MELSPSMIGVLGFAAVFLLILIRMPIAIAFGVVGVTGFAYLLSFQGAMTTLITTVWSQLCSHGGTAIYPDGAIRQLFQDRG